MSGFLFRIRNLFIFILGMLFAYIPRPNQARHRQVLIVQLAKLGDMICTTPMFRALKTGLPDSTLAVLGNHINEEVVAGNPYIDAYVVKPDSLWSTFTMLRKGRYEVMCLTSPNLEMLALSIMARIPTIIVPQIESGWSPYATRFYTLLSARVTRIPHHMGSYAPREYLRQLEPLGVYAEDTRKEVFYTEASKALVAAFFKKAAIPETHMRIGILPGAGNEIKIWGTEKYAALMNDIARRHTNVTFVLLGTEKDRDRANDVVRGLDASVPVVDAIGVFSVDALKACVESMTMVIGVDTGPQYIAEALNVPTIDIVGPCDEREQPPMGKYHLIVKVPREKPELYVMNARVYNKKEALRQSEDITPQMVYDAFVTLCTLLGRS
jgi:ADP-heptose:LPS heptosyltransferase